MKQPPGFGIEIDADTQAAMAEDPHPTDEGAVRRGCWFDPEDADRVCNFFSRRLRFSDGLLAGQPFVLQDWQRRFLRRLFGWKHSDGRRRYTRAYLEVPKKNGKSTLCSGIALYALAADREAGAKVYVAAADRDQARIVFDEAASMTRADEILGGRYVVHSATKELKRRDNAEQEFLKALSAEAPTKEGLKWSCLIFDELHAQPNRRLWDVLRYGGAARRQPLLVAITTAGYDRNSICWEQHDYAEKVNAGTIEDDGYLGVIYAAERDDDWTDPETWRKANPSLGKTMTEASFQEACSEAQESPAKENSFKRYRLNIWTEQAERWLPMDRWDGLPMSLRGDGEPFEWEEAAALCREASPAAWSALDLASTTDLTAFVMLFEEEGPNGERRYLALPRVWIPEANARKREDRDRVPYTLWAKQGYLTMTPGDVIDQDRIVADVLADAERFGVREVAIDRWNADNVERRLDEQGLSVVRFGQGYGSMSAPSKRLEALVLGGGLTHFGNPVLRWAASNVAAEEDAAGNIKPSKKRSVERIDPAVSLIMALGRAMVADDEVVVSPYAAGIRNPWEME